jgi:hypothetical protein
MNALATSLKYVITGPGRSGTTFLTQVFLEAGEDLGAVSPAENGEGPRPEGGGLEHPLFVRINERMLDALKRGQPPEEIMRDLASLMQYPWPAVVKDPRYLATARVWFLAGHAPQHIFLCLREIDAMRHSMQRAWGESQKSLSEGFPRSLYLLLTSCLKQDIPFTCVLYPRIGQDRAYAERVLWPFIQDPWSAVSRVWNDALCHWKDPRPVRILPPSPAGREENGCLSHCRPTSALIDVGNGPGCMVRECAPAFSSAGSSPSTMGTAGALRRF